MSPPEGRRRARAAALAAVVALVAVGCGKGEYRPAQGRTARSAPAARTASPPAPPADAPAGAAAVAGFSHAVQLFAADLPGVVAQAPTGATREQEREAAACGVSGARALGGGRSPDFHRGGALERESFSSAVEVLRTAAQVRSDLAYAASRPGLDCYSGVLRRTLAREQGGRARVTGVRLAALHVGLPGGERATGVRISTRISLARSRVAVTLFLDSVSLPYGQAELDLYADSFVQPPPARTEQELLTLLRERARRHPL